MNASPYTLRVPAVTVRGAVVAVLEAVERREREGKAPMTEAEVRTTFYAAVGLTPEQLERGYATLAALVRERPTLASKSSHGPVMTRFFTAATGGEPGAAD